MEYINANLARMPLVTIIGFPALLTHNKVCKQTVHMNLYIYELQGDYRRDDPIILTDTAEDNFFATVLSPIPLLMDGVTQLLLSPGDIVEDRQSRHYTPAEFESQFYM